MSIVSYLNIVFTSIMYNISRAAKVIQYIAAGAIAAHRWEETTVANILKYGDQWALVVDGDYKLIIVERNEI